MSEMVERVARALAASYGSRICGPGQNVATREIGWKGDGEHLEIYVERHWKEHVHAAQFAISAMREPTEAMKARCLRDDALWDASGAKDPSIAWRAMINAALE